MLDDSLYQGNCIVSIGFGKSYLRKHILPHVRKRRKRLRETRADVQTCSFAKVEMFKLGGNGTLSYWLNKLECSSSS